MIVDKIFLQEIAKQKKHTFISTGMCNLEDIEQAVDIFRKEECPFELMHCVSTYPMETEDANLRVIETLKKSLIVTLVIVDMKVVWQFPSRL